MFAGPEPPPAYVAIFTGVAERAGLTVKHGFSIIGAAILCATMVSATGCGSSDGRDAPPRPISIIEFASYLVDVGERYELDGASSVDPEDDGLLYFWSKIHPTSESEFEDHCEDEPGTVCFTNSDDFCLNDDGSGDQVLCNSNDDCINGDDDRCLPNSGTMSPDCTEGICLLGFSRELEYASFVADRPGPYTIRLLTETTREGTDVGEAVVDTYPQLLVVGSLFGFGGARGALIGEYSDAALFAANAVAGAASPFTGNMLLAVTDPGTVREFSVDDGSIVGPFGETASSGINPIDIVFGQDQDLYTVDADGTVTRFDGATGLLLATVGDVTTGIQQVSSLAIRASNGNLLVADGRVDEAIREHDISDASLVGALGLTGAAAVQAVALAVADDGTMYIADMAGDVIVCDEDGASCAQLGGAASVLAGGGPSAIAINPAGDETTAQIVVTDVVAEQVVGCMADGSGCAAFGDTDGLSSAYADLFFAPTELPTTTTSSTTTTTLAAAFSSPTTTLEY
jgi:hypothetical protein